MTNQDTEQYRLFIEKLKTDEHRPNALNELKNLLSFKPASEAVTTIRNFGISKIVQCVNVANGVEVDLTCEVLRICFEKFDAGDVIKNYTGHIMYLLRHEKSCVRKLALDQVYSAVRAGPTVLPVPDYIDVFVATAQMICEQDISIASRAVYITSNLPAEAYPKVLEEMKLAFDYGSSAKCNAFEVVVNISAKSYDLFKICTDLGYIQFMVSELSSTDVLYQVNILEILSQLAVKPHGINYLVQSGALQNITTLVEDLQNNPLCGLIIPGYIKFFGCVAHHYPKEMFEKYPVLLDALFDALNSEDETLISIGLDAFGFIGSTVEGKLCLVALGSRYTEAVNKVGSLIKNSPTELKKRSLYCFANLISVDKDPNVAAKGPVDHRVTLMTREWFRSLDTNSTKILFDICKNPFPDIRLAALNLLDAVCQHQWGEEQVARTAGFVEYLLDRSTELVKESKEAKFDIIRRLAQSPAFDASTHEKLQTFVEQGPFYSETALEVAMEGDD